MKQKKCLVKDLKSGEIFTLSDFTFFESGPNENQLFFRRFYMPKERKYLVSSCADICLTRSLSGNKEVFSIGRIQHF